MSICTLNELFLYATTHFEKPNLLLHKVSGAYTPLSTGEVRQAVEAMAGGLVALGVEPGDRVALLSENRPGWAIADYAILGVGAVNVPIYPTLPPRQIEYILNDSQSKIIVVSTALQLAKVQEILSAVGSLVKVITLDELDGRDDRILNYSRMCSLGAEKRRAEPDFFINRATRARETDLATIIYTSGTTGQPKGAMLSHRNIVSNIRSCESLIRLTPKDVALSFLPLCHVYERMLDYFYVYKGVSIAYVESVDAVGTNLLEVRPTVMAGIPRMYEKMYGRLKDVAARSSLQSKIFEWAAATGRERVSRTLAKKQGGAWLKFQYRLADRLIFSKFRARFGDRLRFFVSGGAPLSRELAEFFYAAGILILEGYGLTETSPVITFNRLENFRFGTVGQAVPGVEVKIAEDGEVLTRSDSVMMGYYNHPAETAEAMAEGWFHTGDIGTMSDDGFLRITDRKKDLIVTSGGKKVAPQNIENLLKRCACVQNAVVVGNRRNFVSALIVPSFEKVEAFARAHGILFTSREALVQQPAIVDYVLREITAATPDLASFERIKRVLLLPQDFSVESGELTPTMKVKRNVVEAKYKTLLDTLYADARSGEPAARPTLDPARGPECE